ncbi:hypothetical protein [Xanthomonas pisi]|uniref:Uncharacterized protein n=1 Tax=Xanthomonas pisi TaxID=56457 RepID=A0A2S7D4H3_9XANT|nr:hypothetical protein [Xanthomonas pisi]PPU68745.1 hypothetical protein XpiCFBP4643_09655 [Xanthomonas pisi]
MAWVDSIDGLYDFIGLVVLSAPDQFRNPGFLAPEDTLNLERAFIELRSGIALVLQDFPDADNGGRLSRVLDRSLAMYKAGDTCGGAHSLQDFQDLIFKAPA